MSFAYNALKTALGAGFNWTTADVRILLLDAVGGFSGNPDDSTVAALVGELDTAGYARVALTSKAITQDDDANVARWSADDPVFPALGPVDEGPTVAGAVLFVHVTDDSDSWPAVYLSAVGGLTNGADFTVSLDPLGIVRIRDAA